MDEGVKVCPGCGSEYFAHIEECRKCEIPLVFPGQEEEAVKAAENDSGSLVLMESGARERIKWLASALKQAGFISSVFNLNEGESCSPVFGLFVEEVHARGVSKKLEELLHKTHPELIEMEERISSGKCPACGADTSHAVHRCPDCGLNIGGGQGGGGGGYDPSCGTGGCGH
ncbi:MAG: hypothetical protein ACE5EB_07950 [Thermodesulfobacteriota bacterium]